jgi:hypothetical protein
MKQIIFKIGITFLLLSSNALHAQTENLNGYTIGYNEQTKAGCFFVDAQMVESGIATDIRPKASGGCNSDKYGAGVTVYFGEVPADADYIRPSENTLMILSGYWTTNAGKNQFNVTKIEPFF